MASRGAIAGIQAEALKRVEAATAEIVVQLGITVPPAAPHARQADLREAYELERQAVLLEQIAEAIANPKESSEDGEPAGDDSEGSEAPEDDPDGEPDEGHGDDTPVDGTPPDATGDAPVAENPYEGLSFAELKAKAADRGLKPGTSKASAIEALLAADVATGGAAKQGG